MPVTPEPGDDVPKKSQLPQNDVACYSERDGKMPASAGGAIDTQPAHQNVRYSRKAVAFHAVAMLLQIGAIVYWITVLRPPAGAPQDELEKILSLPDAELEKVDIARINLLVAREVFPDLNVDRYLAELDRLAREIRGVAPSYRAFRENPNDPEVKLSVLCTHLHKERGLRYTRHGDSNDPAGLNKDPLNLFLNGVLDRNMGTCVSMPVLYLALGERLGYPIKGVNAKDHFFCRWDDGKFVTNIEPTSDGGWSSDEDYIKDFGITPRQVASGAYMRTLTKREVVGTFYFARAAYRAAAHRDYEKAIRDELKAAGCNPRDADVCAHLAHFFQ
jgi:regulator of sirC expression with transglutaminase-like and TPR domain